jgi:hypothetical protein
MSKTRLIAIAWLTLMSLVVVGGVCALFYIFPYTMVAIYLLLTGFFFMIFCSSYMDNLFGGEDDLFLVFLSAVQGVVLTFVVFVMTFALKRPIHLCWALLPMGIFLAGCLTNWAFYT